MHVAKQINRATNTVCFFFFGGGGEWRAKLTVPSFSKLDAIREIKRNAMQELQEPIGWHYQWTFTKAASGFRQSVLLLDNTK